MKTEEKHQITSRGIKYVCPCGCGHRIGSGKPRPAGCHFAAKKVAAPKKPAKRAR